MAKQLNTWFVNLSTYLIMKKLFTLTALFMLCLGLNAQTVAKLMKSPQVNNIGRNHAPADGEKWWPAFSGGYKTAVGTGKAATYDCAIFVPGQLAGATIESFKVYLASKGVVKEMKVWISESLPSDVTKASVMYKTVETPADVNDIQLDAPCTVTDKGVYVGYTFKITSATSDAAKYPIAISDASVQSAGLWLRTGASWDNYIGMFASPGICAKLTGNIPASAIAMAKEFAPMNVVMGKDGNLTTFVENIGGNDITSLSYTLTNTETGQASGERTIPVSDFSFGTGKAISFAVPADETSGLADKKLTVTKINGESISAVVSATGTIGTLAAESFRKVVEEEFTGTWCGWCTMGIVGIEKMKEKHPDDFIAIAIHGNDPMQINDYMPILKKVEGFPSAHLNRHLMGISPYYGTAGQGVLTIENDFLAEKADLVEASVKVTPTWENEDIKISTDVLFQLNRKDNPFRLIYVVTADELQGTGSSWYQKNYLPSQPSVVGDDPNLQEAAGWGATIKNMKYNHVAVAAYGVEKGLENSITGEIAAGKTVNHVYTASVKNNKLIQNKDKVNVVAMLVNTKTGIIVNADCAKVTGVTGIETLSGETSKNAPIYSVSGMKVGQGESDFARLPKGMYIINGKKVMK